MDDATKRNAEPSQLIILACHDLAPLGPNVIIWANAMVMQQREMQFVQGDPLDAFNLGGEEEPNVDMYLNLQNVEDVEMSTDSSKRKRNEEGEEATSKGP